MRQMGEGEILNRGETLETTFEEANCLSSRQMDSDRDIETKYLSIYFLVDHL